MPSSKKVNYLLNELTMNAYKYFDSDLEKLVKTKKMKIDVDEDYEMNQENDLTLYGRSLQDIEKYLRTKKITDCSCFTVISDT